MITNVRIDTIDARSARSACVHTAIVNISQVMDGEILVGFAVYVSNVLLFRSSHNLHKQHAG